ncbi:MAG TPA: HemK/PrmC family methyltransferase [Acidimicrobiales bacterium]|nr:HemK/PrmC family methyltransferase [Acidimicrobiales bacterium]
MSDVAARLASAGFLSADEEAVELEDAAAGDATLLESMVRRREQGEPLAWITGSIDFGGERVHVAAGVYVPRLQSVPLAQQAAHELPPGGGAVDLCTGAGAVAAFVLAHRPDARVVATDVDEHAVECARTNGVDAHVGDLFGPLPSELRGHVDVVTAVAPYVPTPELQYLPRDVRAYEPQLALDGGGDGLDVVRRIVSEAPSWLRAGGSLLLEIGGDQASVVRPLLHAAGFGDVDTLVDAEGDVRGISARLP